MAGQTAVPNDLIELGRVVSAYGVRGWVKIQPYSTEAEALLTIKNWWLKAPQTAASARGDFAVPANVVQVKRHSATIVALLDTVTDREAAQALKGHTIWASRAQFPAQQENEYYWVDLIGCQVYGEDNAQPVLLGEVSGVLDNGAHAVLRVQRTQQGADGCPVALLDEKGRPVEVLVPFVEAHVHTVDLAGKTIHSNWPASF